MKQFLFLTITSFVLGFSSKAQIKPTLEPCDSSICVTNRVNPNDLLRPTAEELTNMSKRRYKMGDFTCDQITFYKFKNEHTDEVVFGVGERQGTLIKIERENYCDDHKETQAVPIMYNGKESYAVIGFNGDPFLLDKLFFNIITDDTLWCKGLPPEPTRYHTCKICSARYASQKFRAKDKVTGKEEDTATYYTSGGCPKSSTGNHDGLVLTPGKSCGIKGTSY